MSDTRQAELIHALSALRGVLSATTAGADHPELRARGQRYADLATYIIANVTTTVGQHYAARVDDNVMHRVAIELDQARVAAANASWERVLQHSRAMLSVLPGDPVSYPKENLPPL
jgi:hypothetical protein